MKSIAWIAAVAALACLPAWGQSPAKPAAKPQPEQAKAKPPSAEAKAAHKSRRHEDARACLERPTNSEIIKCAEAYL